MGKMDTAKVRLLKYQDEEDDLDGIVSMTLGCIYSREGQRDSARVYFNRALPYAGLRQQVTLHEELARLDYAEGRYVEAFSHASQSMALRDSVTSLTETEEVAKINALYNYHRTEEMNRQLEQRNRRQRGWLYGIVSAALLAACATAVWLRQKKHEAALQRQKIRNLEAEQYRRSEAYRAESRRQLAELEVQLCKAEKTRIPPGVNCWKRAMPCWSCRQRKTGLNSRNAACLSPSFTVLLSTHSSTRRLTRR